MIIVNSILQEKLPIPITLFTFNFNYLFIFLSLILHIFLGNINFTLQQVKYLHWDGKYGSKNQKVGQWRAFWKGNLLNVGDGVKQYLKELLNKIKDGNWNIQFRVDSDQDFETIGGGLYDDINGQKIGEWIDLHENYDRDWCQIKYKGIYNNGIKNGKWDIHFRAAVDEEFIVIGGDHYNGNNGLKHVEWLDLHPNFNCHNQIMLKGQYQNGECQGNFTELQLE